MMKFETLLNRLVPMLYEDDYLLVVNKPAGIDAGGLDRQSRPGLAEILSEVRGRSETFEVTNRLSRYESGILIFGKNPAIVQHIRTGLKSRRIKLEYTAVVVGHMKQKQQTIGTGRESSRGKSARRPERSTTNTNPSSHSASATNIKSLKNGEKRSIIRCQTSVSTTHALKAQLRSARLRTLGDILHNNAKRPATQDKTCLHLSHFSFFHPILKKKLSFHSKAPESFTNVIDGKFDVFRPLQAALVRRLSCYNTRDTDAIRLLSGDQEDVKGLMVEKFGNVIVIQLADLSPKLSTTIKDIARWYQKLFDVQAVYIWDRSKQHSQAAGEKNSRAAGFSPRGVSNSRTAGKMKSRVNQSQRSNKTGPTIIGHAADSQIYIREFDLKFLIRPNDGPAVGLFLDHRENRQRIRSMSKGLNVLNLFAYTCGFSVSAAAGGANKTVSVDLSAKMLDWGKENFERNNLAIESHQFFNSDASEFLKRAKRQEMHFDLIILDPPSFAHGRKRKQDFSISRDLSDLIAASASVLNPEGVMMIATNYRRMSNKGLRERIHRGAHIAGRRYKVMDVPKLPADFDIDPDHAKTIFVKFD